MLLLSILLILIAAGLWAHVLVLQDRVDECDCEEWEEGAR